MRTQDEDVPSAVGLICQLLPRPLSTSRPLVERDHSTRVLINQQRAQSTIVMSLEIDIVIDIVRALDRHKTKNRAIARRVHKSPTNYIGNA